MGGRIAAIDGTADSPSTIYVGAASGGVWKSTDNGTSFKPVFDEHPQSIGAIAIDKSNPQTVRSEEHTSELQSQSNLVCRLLLEKKKKKNKTHRQQDTTAHNN